MKPTCLAGLFAGVLLLGGCQSLSWTTGGKTPKSNPVAKTENIREVPWTWRKKKTPAASGEMPPEIAAKFDKAKKGSDSTKSATEWVAEGNQQELTRNFPAARKAYEGALTVDPVNADAHHRLGILADMRQEYSVAQDHYEAALRQKPHDPNLLSDYGYSHQLRGNVNQSERFLLQALDLDAQHKQAIKNLGTLYAQQNRYDDALHAFRRLRPAAEAQQLMSQYFPNGRDGGGSSPIVAARQASDSRTAPPMPQDDLDPETLKTMSQQQIFDLMEQRRQESVRAREQKDLAEFRPNLPPSSAEQEYRDSWAAGNPAAVRPDNRPRSGGDWAQEPAGGATARSVPPGLDPTNHRAAPREPSGNMASPEHQAQNEMPYWSGNPVQRSPASNGQANPAENSPRPPNGNQSLASVNGPGGGMAPPPWWAEDPSAANRQPIGQSSGFNISRQEGNAAESANANWNQATPSQGGFGNGPRDSGSPPMSPNQRAYQLGMSVGPGAMFPVAPPEEANQMAAVNSSPGFNPQRANPQWSNSSTPAGYQESRMAPPVDSQSAHAQWRDAPIDVAPRSPTENWNPPSMTAWPPNSATVDTNSRGNVAPRPTTGQLPMITPGPGGPNNQASNGSRGSGRRTSNPPSGSDAGVVPAWYDSPVNAPAPATRAGGATSLQQWPYAPK